MKTDATKLRIVALSSSTSRSTLTIHACCGWSATQPRSACLFGVLCVCLLCCVTPILAAELKRPSPLPSDALFDPSRVIQIEIRLDSKDWLALRISHPILENENNISKLGRLVSPK